MTEEEALKAEATKLVESFKELKVFVGLNQANYENGVLTIGGQTSVVLK